MLRFRFTSIGPVRIQATVDGERLPASEYASSGEHVYLQPIRLTSESVSIRFELDKALAPSSADRRELGVQVKFWSYDDSVPRALTPITVS
jgi:hypothetical protein